MKKLMKSNDPKNVKADKIKTRIESELKQVRYDDPLLFEEFSTKIKKTLAEYDETRDADKYFTAMETMADDFRHGRLSKEYPASITNDSDTKAFYGAVVNVLRSKADLCLSDDVENAIAEHSRRITQAVSTNAKRDGNIMKSFINKSTVCWMIACLKCSMKLDMRLIIQILIHLI